MRIIVLFGHVETAKDAYTQVDAVLRERDERNVVLAQTDWHIDRPMAQALRLQGAELWYCGPRLAPPGGGDAADADRYLLGDSYAAIAPKALAAVTDFLARPRTRS